ncbi:hypothetical protein ASZ90_010497 [hydrocarbon metagenome]|uniref:Uncharacterized protein n=1 Tax=hydrocarbon metagenome TaxID=938273 RepID=A0A0W8FHI6_9ZZZZ
MRRSLPGSSRPRESRSGTRTSQNSSIRREHSGLRRSAERRRHPLQWSPRARAPGVWRLLPCPTPLPDMSGTPSSRFSGPGGCTSPSSAQGTAPSTMPCALRQQTPSRS